MFPHLSDFEPHDIYRNYISCFKRNNNDHYSLDNYCVAGIVFRIFIIALFDLDNNLVKLGVSQIGKMKLKSLE